ncbi:MAG: ankyrin repeat domain-containing protein [Treponema sp.]|jgi:ankyrin repeat protein|nr:ankyrin repeat domain-containing protein [Treponema sp.]
MKYRTVRSLSLFTVLPIKAFFIGVSIFFWAFSGCVSNPQPAASPQSTIAPQAKASNRSANSDQSLEENTEFNTEDDVWALLERGESGKAREFFLGKVDVKATDSRGRTPLHMAAEIKDPELAKFFIFMGAEIDPVDNQGRTPLGISAAKHDAATAQVLVAAGADIHHSMPGGTSPALTAVGMAGGLLSAMINSETLRTTDSNGRNILDLAFAYPDSKVHMESAEALVLAGGISKNPIFSYFAPAARTSNYNRRAADGVAPLHFAAGNGYTGLIAFLIEKKADVNIKNASGTTPLHEAARSGNIAAMELLIKSGAEINAQDAKGNSVLHIAVPMNTHKEALSLFLSKGANPNLRDEHGDSPLHIAIRLNRNPDIIRTLLAGGIKGKADVSIRNTQGKTPLHLAVEEDRITYIPLLLEYKSDIFSVDNDRVTPFEKALQEHHTLLPTLITAQTVLQNDSSGNTLLHITVQKRGDIKFIELILDKKALVNARNKEGDTSLHLAVRQNDQAAGELLLSRGADIFAPNSKGESPLYQAFYTSGGLRAWILTSETLKVKDGLGNTILHYAAQWKLDQHIPLIIERGGNPEATNATGETPLFAAVKIDSPSTIRVLKSKGSLITTRDILGNSALHAAVRWNAPKAAEELIASGIDINGHALNGKTPLHDAVRLGITPLETILIANKADLEVRDAEGNTPLMEAALAGGPSATVERLVNKGADPFIRNDRGDTPCHIAVITEQEDLVKLLLRLGTSIHAKNSSGMTPFRNGLISSPKMVSLLLTKDRIAVPDDDGFSPLHIAIQDRAPKSTIQLIIDQGARVSAVDAEGRTPLRLTVDQNAWELAQLLIEKGSNIFSTAADGKTPAQLVLSKGNEAIKLFFNSNKAINAQDPSGNTVLHLAAQTGKPEIVSLLIELGANKTIKNIAAESPVDIAQRWKRDTVVVLLQ